MSNLNPVETVEEDAADLLFPKGKLIIKNYYISTFI